MLAKIVLRVEGGGAGRGRQGRGREQMGKQSEISHEFLQTETNKGKRRSVLCTLR